MHQAFAPSFGDFELVRKGAIAVANVFEEVGMVDGVHGVLVAAIAIHDRHAFRTGDVGTNDFHQLAIEFDVVGPKHGVRVLMQVPDNRVDLVGANGR